MRLLLALLTLSLTAATTVTITTDTPVTIIHNGTQLMPGMEMHGGLPADLSTLPPMDPGASDLRVRPTSERPADSTSGAFRTVCTLAAVSYNDPIVYPGQAGKAHLHTFVGNTGANAYSTTDSLNTTGGSTCRGGIFNRSAYWVPALLDEKSKPVIPTTFLIYYKAGDFNSLGSSDGRTVNGVFVPWQPPVVFKELPKGLRMIAGNPSRTSAPASSEDFAYRWKCDLKGVVTFASSIPVCPSGATLYQEVFFPQCWDGKNLDSPDHKSHLSYGVMVRNAGDPRNWSHRECPATHPVVLPKVSFEIAFNVADTSKLRLASDAYDATKPGGFSSHGDWFGAWLEQPWVKGCVQANKDCHAHLTGDGREMY